MLLSASGMQTSPLSSGIFWQESVYHKKCKSLRSLQVQNPSPSNQGLAWCYVPNWNHVSVASRESSVSNSRQGVNKGLQISQCSEVWKFDCGKLSAHTFAAFTVPFNDMNTTLSSSKREPLDQLRGSMFSFGIKPAMRVIAKVEADIRKQIRPAGLSALANYLAFNQSESTVDRFAIALKTCGVFLVSVPWSSQSGTSSCYGGWSAQIQSAAPKSGVTAHVSQKFQAICISHTRSHNKSTLEASLLQDGCVGGIHKAAVRSKQLRSNSQMFGAVPPCTVWRLRPVSNKVFCSGRRDDLGDDSWDAVEPQTEVLWVYASSCLLDGAACSFLPLGLSSSVSHMSGTILLHCSTLQRAPAGLDMGIKSELLPGDAQSNCGEAFVLQSSSWWCSRFAGRFLVFSFPTRWGHCSLVHREPLDD